MIELTDNINWNNFLAELKPRSWYKKREGEGNVDWIKRVAIKDSNWLEKAKWGERNQYWLDVSSDFTLSILAFMSFHDLSVEQMEEDLNMELDLSGSYDWRMSETEKIKQYMILYNGN
jgi:hypothetical protein